MEVSGLDCGIDNIAIPVLPSSGKFGWKTRVMLLRNLMLVIGIFGPVFFFH